MVSLDEVLAGEVADAVLGALIRDLTQRVRVDGGSVPSWVFPVCEALQEASGRARVVTLPRGSAAGTVGVTVDSLLKPVGEAADLVGVSPEYVRRLCRTGRVRCHRAGREWLVDIESLAGVTRRRIA